ncbi:MAG: hypothetical protein MK179_20090 [Pirellulaceae bacterium]|nr:hypothetical protein [Pirellulaceae bacterium]
MNNVMKTSYLAGYCLSSVLIMSSTTTAAPQACSYTSNWITQELLCSSSEVDNPFCYLHNLAPVQGTDRVIWDGSFTSSTSECDGPGGRWTGTTAQVDEWNTISRFVDNRSGDGELVLTTAGGPISARVFGQTFGEAAAYVSSVESADVVVPSASFIRVKFNASIRNLPPGDNIAWFKVRFGLKNADGTYDELPEYIEGAGHNDLWLIDIDAGGESQCVIDFPLDQIGCPNINIKDWVPMVQFGLAGSNSNPSCSMRIDDIDVNIAQLSLGDPTNLVSGSVNLDDPRSWTLIGRSHWQGGGTDNTTGVSATRSPCLADTNWDGVVDVEDLLNVIGRWGDPSGPGNVNCDGNTDVVDLVMVLGAWGACP